MQEWGAGTAEAPIAALLLFTDPADWYLDLQFCSDVILGNGVLRSTATRVAPGELPKEHADLLLRNQRHSSSSSDAGSQHSNGGAAMRSSDASSSQQTAGSGSGLTADAAQAAAGRAQHLGAEVMQPSHTAAPSDATTVRVIAAQNDLLWSTGFPVPRYGLGAFVAALRALLQAAAPERTPQIEFFGKPTLAPYLLAERLLDAQAHTLGACSLYL